MWDKETMRHLSYLPHSNPIPVGEGVNGTAVS